MPLPPMTPEQRTAALKKAAEARQARTQLLAAIRSGEKKLPEILTTGKGDPIIGKTKVAQLLRAVPGLGPVKINSLLEEAGIDANRRVAGLGEKQRQALLDALN